MALPGEGELRPPRGAVDLPLGDHRTSETTPAGSFSIGNELELDRRRIARVRPVAFEAAEASPDDPPGGAFPLVVPASRRNDAADRWLEEASRTDDLLRRMGETLLSNPLDPRPVPALERRATATGNELLLAGLYEALLDSKPDHPSRETLLRRIDRLRAASPPTPTPTLRFVVGAEQEASTDLPWNAPETVEGRVLVGEGLDDSEDLELRSRLPTLTGLEVDIDLNGGSAPSEATADVDDVEEIRPGLESMIARSKDTEGASAPRIVVTLRRIAAWGIDGALLAASSGLILVLGIGSVQDVAALVTGHPSGAGQGASLAGLALAAAIAFVYLTLCWSLGGRTLGGSLTGLRAVDRDSGAPLAIGRAALRAVFAIAGTVAFLAGPLWALVDRDGEALHDKLARSAVVPH